MRLKTKSSEQAILDGAKQRLDVVNSKINDIRPMAITDDTSEYQKLIMERGRLNLVIAQAEKILS